MNTQNIGVGVVGTAFGARVHVPAFRAAEQCTVIGIASRDPAHARSTAERLQLPQAFETWQELVASPEVDVVSIATPPSLHADIVTAALHAKKAVLCEKPFAMGSEEALRLLAEARNTSLVHAVNFLFRELPVFQEMRRAVASGALGALRSVEISWSVGSWADPRRPWQWQCREEEGGGILGALVVHALDTLEWMCGPIARLSAHLRISIPERPAADGRMQNVTAPDFCQLLLVLQNGAPVTCTVTNVAPQGTGHRIVIHGERKTMMAVSDVVSDYAKGFRLFEGDQKGTTFVEKPLVSFADASPQDGRIALMTPLVRSFLAAVHGAIPMEPSFREGARTQMLLDAIRTADKTHQWVECSPLL